MWGTRTNRPNGLSKTRKSRKEKKTFNAIIEKGRCIFTDHTYYVHTRECERARDYSLLLPQNPSPYKSSYIFLCIHFSSDCMIADFGRAVYAWLCVLVLWCVQVQISGHGRRIVGLCIQNHRAALWFCDKPFFHYKWQRPSQTALFVSLSTLQSKCSFFFVLLVFVVLHCFSPYSRFAERFQFVGKQSMHT